MAECPPCNNHCYQGRNCPNLATRETIMEHKYIKHQIMPMPPTRNEVLEEVAKEFDKMPFGDTAASFAKYVRDMKT